MKLRVPQHLTEANPRKVPNLLVRKVNICGIISNLVQILTFAEYEEVIATLERLQGQMKGFSGMFGMSESGIAAELEAVTRLLTQKRFADALSTFHTLKNKLHNTGILKPNTNNASNLTKDVSINCFIQTLVKELKIDTYNFLKEIEAKLNLF